ncbi:Hint domain-containing protein [Bordetella sp. 02P26C-1]|uniref:Hint domain-containing protein n=1 Tax=Bordetella sp. 02P26C-1 TaxID=2683195 RepID=UPI0013540730|nr:Hint domain-containing protein [Bordetella sp. 02P26C-1]MVW77720.1 hypothetical protein [Bordetella sp. 02P26C-1]
MATFSPPGYYNVQVSGPNRDFHYIWTGYNDVPVVATNTSVVDAFNVGDALTVQDVTGERTEWVVGFTSDGVLVENEYGDFRLLTYNRDYPPGEILTLNDNQFPVCFVKGSMIDTDRGAVPIECLIPGDRVWGSTGLRTVKWLGWRHYHAVTLRTPEQRAACLPVRISAGALGANQPSHTLRVSPWHHLYIDGVLVRARDLINGESIVQESATTEFSYYHVELDQFDVIRTYGVFSESWADGGNRDFFQNVDVTTLQPADTHRRMADRPGFVALRKPQDIAPIRDKLATRAVALRARREAA